METAEELFEPGEYLSSYRPGYFSLLSIDKGNSKQQSFEIQHLATVIEAANPNIDTYISQAQFRAKNRRAANVDSVALFFVDLDTYHIEGLRNQPPEKVVWLIRKYCDGEGIPQPSLILYSGNGFYVKWLLDDAVTAERLIEWNAVQIGLVRSLKDFGSDWNAKDISRVLRLDHTVNTKTGNRCRVVDVYENAHGNPVRYSFEDFTETFPPEQQQPYTPEGTSAEATPHTGVNAPTDHFAIRRLNWARFHDIRKLWEMRGGVPVGFRELTLFWELNFMFRAEPVRAAELWKEAQNIASTIDQTPGWYANSNLTTVYRKARETLEGKSVTFNGRRYPALYTPRNTTLINTFHITEDEQRELSTIIDRDEKVRRRREKRWAEGVQEQPYRYEKPWEHMGISRATYYRRVKEQAPRSRRERERSKCLTTEQQDAQEQAQ